jgi:hypothetical protein
MFASAFLRHSFLLGSHVIAQERLIQKPLDVGHNSSVQRLPSTCCKLISQIHHGCQTFITWLLLIHWRRRPLSLFTSKATPNRRGLLRYVVRQYVERHRCHNLLFQQQYVYTIAIVEQVANFVGQFMQSTAKLTINSVKYLAVLDVLLWNIVGYNC